MEEVLVKTFFRFFRISGPAGSGKPGASQLGESLGQEESNDTSNMRIGPAVPPTHPLHYSYFNPIFIFSEPTRSWENLGIRSTENSFDFCHCVLFVLEYLLVWKKSSRHLFFPYKTGPPFVHRGRYNRSLPFLRTNVQPEPEPRPGRRNWRHSQRVWRQMPEIRSPQRLLLLAAY